MRLVGLDVGTSSVKGVAIGEDGQVVKAAERPHKLSTPAPGWAEQDPENWWVGARDVLDELGKADAIGLTGQMHGLVALGAGDKLLRPAILWNDGRSQKQCDEIVARVGLERLVSLTGNRAFAGFTAPKLLWMREQEPDLFKQVESVLLPKDYVRLRLTGEKATDVADASGTLLFDVGARGWSDEMCSALDVDRSWLPVARESPELSGETPEGVPVVSGAGDQAAGALGMGVVAQGGPASVVLGTSGVVFAAQASFMPDPEARLHTFCHAVPGIWHTMGVILSAAGSLAWLQKIVGGSYEELDVAAAGWAPGAEGLLFAPYLAGDRTPHADADARGAFTGLGLRHDRGALTRAVLEGVAFALADALELIEQVGERPAVGRVSGGGAKSDLWLEIVASVLNLPLEVAAIDEGAAYGAAMLAGIGSGAFDDADDAVGRCVKIVRTVEPNPQWVERYAQIRSAYKELYPALERIREAT
jgi:xylulokinase